MGSASQPMLVVKANRALLKKRRSYKEIREAYNGYLDETQLEFKELTPFEQKKIRDKIIAQAKRDRLEELKVSLYSVAAIGALSFIVYLFFFG